MQKARLEDAISSAKKSESGPKKVRTKNCQNLWTIGKSARTGQMGHQTVTVVYDYAGIEQWATGRWKANTRTTQEYVRFIADCPITITWQKVPAHSGIPMNELVDQLATGAAHASNEHHSV